ncbi:peroxisome biogenesis protein 12-like, partial [Cannabis sativa]|uniref:peroxisome biogenesis protein 12-like n=1 Tax=Cannabis sativa TaxID=3483 RepID=UPI0029CA4DCB
IKFSIIGLKLISFAPLTFSLDASFAESLYGLRRRAVDIKVKKDNTHLNSGSGIHHSGLKRRQKVLSVVFLVILPYLKSRLHSIYNRERDATLQATLWGHEDERFNDINTTDRGDDSLVSSATTVTESSLRAQLLKKIQRIIGACYPWVHASSEGLSFSYQLLSLLDATGFYSLGLHALGIHVCPATGQELGIVVGLDNLDGVIRIIRESSSNAVATVGLKNDHAYRCSEDVLRV